MRSVIKLRRLAEFPSETIGWYNEVKEIIQMNTQLKLGEVIQGYDETYWKVIMINSYEEVETI